MPVYTKSPNSNVETKKREGRPSLPDLWFKDQQLKHAIFKMHVRSRTANKTLTIGDGDPFCLLSDETLSLIISKLPISHHASISLVCKRWFSLQGRLVQSLTLLDWEFLESGRLTCRFPNLTEIHLVRACFPGYGNSGILLSHKLASVHIDSEFVNDKFLGGHVLLDSDTVDRGLKMLAHGCPNLRKLELINASYEGLGYLAEKCVTLQELEIDCCNDMSLKAISGFKNLQLLKLVGSVDGLYDSMVTDIGLTILAQGCWRLLKLELVGCEGSYDGLKAIGQCCPMLEELTLSDHRMDGGWLAALSYCCNLKTLKFQSCKTIDSSPGADEHLGSCPTLEELYLERCQLRDKRSMKALLVVCESVKAIAFQDCWGLGDDMLRLASICRTVKSLSLKGCSLPTIEGLDSVLLSWKDLEMLSVVSCNNIKDNDITPAMATLFSTLKELKWRPDTRSRISSGLMGTGVGKKGTRFFKRMVTVADKRK